jgi:uncharacterized coiled-coil protein SlyX
MEDTKKVETIKDRLDEIKEGVVIREIARTSGGFFLALPQDWARYRYVIAKKENDTITINSLEHTDQINLIDNKKVIIRKLNLTPSGTVYFRIPTKWYKETNPKAVLMIAEKGTIKIRPIKEKEIPNQSAQTELNKKIEKLKKKLKKREEQIKKLSEALIAKYKEVDRLNDELSKKQKRIEELSNMLNKILKAASQLNKVRE